MGVLRHGLQSDLSGGESLIDSHVDVTASLASLF